jgi:hypothetical protein
VLERETPLYGCSLASIMRIEMGMNGMENGKEMVF